MIAQLASTLLLFGVLVFVIGAIKVWTYCVGRWRLREAVVPYEPRRPVPWSFVDLLVVILILVGTEGAMAVALHWTGPDEHVADEQLASPVMEALEAGESQAVENATREEDAAEAATPPRKLTIDDVPWLLLNRIVGPLLALLFVKLRSRATWADLGFSTERLAGDLQLGVLAFVAIGPPIYALQALLQQIYPGQHQMIELFQQFPQPSMLVVLAFLVVVVAPLSEEFIIRVLWQGWFEQAETSLRPDSRLRRLPLGLLPILLSSLVFALLHAGYGPDPVPIFLLALVLGYLYQRTHRIWPGVAMHMSLNGTSTAALVLTLAIGEPPAS